MTMETESTSPQEQLDEGSAYKEELKRKESERIAREKAEKEWWESRQDG